MQHEISKVKEGLPSASHSAILPSSRFTASCQASTNNTLIASRGRSSRITRTMACRHQASDGNRDDDGKDGDDAGAVCTMLAGSLSLSPVAKHSSFTFWLDEALWSTGRPSIQLLEEVLLKAGGVRTGGPSGQSITSRQPDHLGADNLNKWDLLWTKSTYALPAAKRLRKGQLVSVVVGLNCLTMKKRMLQTLKAAYGDAGAAQLTPLSFALPEELDKWQQHLKQEQQLQAIDTQQEDKHEVASQGNQSQHLWILKTGQDAGRGLQLLPASEALQAAQQDAQRNAGTDKQATNGHGSSKQHPLQVAQTYLSQPMLLQGRKFHLRLWLVVTQHKPIKAYLHKRGLVLFSSEVYDAATPWRTTSTETVDVTAEKEQPQSDDARVLDKLQGGQNHDRRHIAAGHITNLARNSKGLVWSLQQLEETLGADSYRTLWHSIQRCLRLSLNAAYPLLQEGYAWLKPPFPEYGFQLLGVDFLVDRQLRPWLLEFNSSPSIMALHDDAATAALVYREKYKMLEDMFGLVSHRVYPASAQQAKQQHAASTLGEFIDLFAS